MTALRACWEQASGADRNSGAEFGGGFNEAAGDGFDGGLVAGVFEGAFGGEGFVGFDEGELVGEDEAFDVGEDGADRDEAAEAAQRAGGGGEEGNDFLVEAIEGGFVGDGAGDPVDGVFKDGGDGGVVLGAGEEEGVVGEEEVFEFAGVGGEAVGLFVVAVEEGEGVVAEVDEGDGGAGGAGGARGDGDEFFVEAAGAKGAGEGEDARGGHGGLLKVVAGLNGWLIG